MTSSTTPSFRANWAARVISTVLPFAALAAASFDAAALFALGKAIQVLFGAR